MSMSGFQSRRKIRLLIVTQNLDRGGLEEVILTYATLLNRTRYEVAVAYRVQGVVSEELSRLPETGLFCYERATRHQRFFALWRFAQSFKPDIVHNHFNWYGLIIGLLVGAKRVETIHNTYSWFTARERISYNLHCLLASRIIAVSDHVRRFSVKFFPLLALKKTVVIHNGIDRERFEGSDDGGLRSELGIGSDEVVIGFIGRLEEQKGVTYLLHAVAEMKEYPGMLKIVIVGEGTLKQRLQDEAARLGLSNVLFLGYRRNTPRLLRMFDVFVLPSLFEGLPVVLIEAMAAGCAVVATRIGGVEEVVAHGVNGLLVEAGNSTSLASALRELIVSPVQRKRLSAQARKTVEREFSAGLMIERTEKVYRSLVSHLFEEPRQ